MLDGWNKFPVRHMAGIHFPVWMKGKLGGQGAGEESQHRRKHKPLAGVAIKKSVTDEDVRCLNLGVSTADG
jgi:predicted transcriptional regulator